MPWTIRSSRALASRSASSPTSCPISRPAPTSITTRAPLAASSRTVLLPAHHGGTPPRRPRCRCRSATRGVRAAGGHRRGRGWLALGRFKPAENPPQGVVRRVRAGPERPPSVPSLLCPIRRTVSQPQSEHAGPISSLSDALGMIPSSRLTMALHSLGYPVQPQNCWPRRAPLRAVRSTIGRLHSGHVCVCACPAIPHPTRNGSLDSRLAALVRARTKVP